MECPSHVLQVIIICMSIWAEDTGHWAKPLASKPYTLSLIPRTEHCGRRKLSKVILCSPYISYNSRTHTHTQNRILK